MKFDDKINSKNIREKNRIIFVHVKIKKKKNRNFDLLTSPMFLLQNVTRYMKIRIVMMDAF